MSLGLGYLRITPAACVCSSSANDSTVIVSVTQVVSNSIF